jgi:hypothetical protein
MPLQTAACKKGESTIPGALPLLMFKILLVLFF